MNIRLVNKEIQFATYKITATKTFGQGERERTIEKESLAFDVEQKDKIVADFESKGYTVIVEELAWDDEIVQKAQGFTGYTLEQAKKYLTTTSKDELIQSMALAIASLDAEIQTIKGGDA